MENNALYTILLNIINFIQGGTGKMIFMVVLTGGGAVWWLNLFDKKKWGIGLIVGVVLTFSGGWVAKNILGIDVPV